jgi:hypothetical protein
MNSSRRFYHTPMRQMSQKRQDIFLVEIDPKSTMILCASIDDKEERLIDKAVLPGADVVTDGEPSSPDKHLGQRVRQLRMARGFRSAGWPRPAGCRSTP